MKAHAPASLTALPAARAVGNARRSAQRAAGRAWARDWRERNRAMFDRMDADKNGSVTRAEFDAAKAGRHGKGGRGH